MSEQAASILTIRCSQCRTSFRLSGAKVAGRRISSRCTACGARITIDGTVLGSGLAAQQLDQAAQEYLRRRPGAIDPRSPLAMPGGAPRVLHGPFRSFPPHRLLARLLVATSVLCLAAAAIAFTLPRSVGQAGGAPPLQEFHPCYPVQAGRWWSYRTLDDELLERRVLGHQHSAGHQVARFQDGTVAYAHGLYVVEASVDGALAMLPLGQARRGQTVVYTTSGLTVQRTLGAIDTTVVLRGHQYEHCIEVLTTTRPVGGGDGPSVGFTAYYAKGIGLVGTDHVVPEEHRELSLVLESFGVE